VTRSAGATLGRLNTAGSPGQVLSRLLRRSSLRDSIGAVLLTLVLVGALLAALGANPLAAYGYMIQGSLGNQQNLIQTATIFAPLLLSSVAVVIPFSARVFNIGVAGQLIIGGVCATCVVFSLRGIPQPLLVTISILAAIAGGSIWAMIAGVLKAYRRANEVIVTLMMNFLALLVASRVVNGPWNNPGGLQTKTFPGGVGLPTFSGGFDISFIVATIVAFGAFVLMFRTRFGFSVRAVGFNPNAALRAGYNPRRVGIAAMAVAGAAAGLSGALIVLGTYHALLPDISSNYGYLAIAVALIAALNPLALIPVTFVFAVIIVGSNSLPATSGVSSATSSIVLAIFVLILLILRIVRVPEPESR
jgi:simple sugar transport system permease protein